MAKIGAIVFLCISLVSPASIPPTPLYIVAGQSNAWPTAEYTSRYMAGLYIDCSKGGSSISEWIPTWYLYKRCLDFVKGLVETKKYYVAGMIWFQGETDAGWCTFTETWKSRFEFIVRKMRSDLLLDFPVVYVQLGHPPNPPMCWNIIRKQIAMVSLRRSRMVYTFDIPRGSGKHYLPGEYIRIGYRVFVNMIKIKTTP